MRLAALGSLFAVTLLFFALSCGGSADDCKVTAQMAPLAATIDHLAAAPANTQEFQATRTFTGQCAQAAVNVLPTVTWTNSDTVNATIASTNVIAQNTAVAEVTCKGPTSATITATFETGTSASGPRATATLTCR